MTMPERQTLPLLTIQGVSERCGVNAVTLRAWERRYGLIQPERTAKGHRRYTPAQVERVQAIVEWLNKGVPIRQVRDLLDRQADSARPNTESAGDESPTQENAGQGEVWQAAHREMLAALQDLNAQRIEQCLNRLLRDYGHEAVISQLSDPLRQQLAASASLAMQRALLDSVLMQKWSARALSLVPGRRESGWLLVPFGDPLGVLELAMVMSSPVWCLSGPVAAQALAQQAMARKGCGVLWWVDAMPTAAQREKWLPQAQPAFPVRAWGPLASTLMPSDWVITGTRKEVANQLPPLPAPQKSRSRP
ncbi:MAG: MerR family transcriptional regulator [Pseudomonadales bacterium]|nr:MerR family transcriptional regulator [Pseudomonadales bacterium]|tara:strand:+ start:1652 stop:2569 length:918 start_codon:yes stop_codon:yes gene_type:complete